ncbi:uncharacterized protein METZ01_LOCUS384631 [marine metagenome]|uniref:Uncharacterized protein n=1 Tax=marine metagenome TaxID=408172 RepID=A0A382UCL5_9ZZZZ
MPRSITQIDSFAEITKYMKKGEKKIHAQRLKRKQT